MTSARRRPIVVEIRPDDVKHSTAPSSPRKTVRFSDEKEIVPGATRQPTPTEAWSLYHFETHARACLTCHEPFKTVSNGGHLCRVGRDLAHDASLHVHYRDGQVYSTQREGSRDIRVEVPAGYDRLVGLLRGMHRRRRKDRLAPIINYEMKYPPARKSPAVQPIIEEDLDAYSPTYVIPAQSGRRSRHKHYSTIVVGNDNDLYDRSRLASLDVRRGSLYKESSHSRKPKEYHIEVVEPEDRHHRRYKSERYHD